MQNSITSILIIYFFEDFLYFDFYLFLAIFSNLGLILDKSLL